MLAKSHLYLLCWVGNKGEYFELNREYHRPTFTYITRIKNHNTTGINDMSPNNLISPKLH